jgi:DNA-binding transcriptional MocR family regulator
VDGWRAATDAALAAHGWRALTYGYAPGPGPLVEWLAEHLGRTDARRPDPGEIFVTNGASQGLELTLATLTRPGDVMVVQAPTYHLALRTIADHRVELVAAPEDAEGVDPDATAELIDRRRADGRRVSMLYLVPTFTNPTGRCLGDERRRALVGLARAHEVTIVEDDTYRDLVYAGDPPPSLWSLADGAPVVRLGSFSKTVAPGLRLGWLTAEAARVGALSRRGYVHSGGGLNHTTALGMAAYGRSGAYTRHLAALRRRYARQRDALVVALRRHLPAVAVPEPRGGWFLWLRLPPGCSASDLLTTAGQRGVAFVPGGAFFPDDRGDDHLRLSYSYYEPGPLAEAARRLGETLRSACGSPPPPAVRP